MSVAITSTICRAFLPHTTACAHGTLLRQASYLDGAGRSRSHAPPVDVGVEAWHLRGGQAGSLLHDLQLAARSLQVLGGRLEVLGLPRVYLVQHLRTSRQAQQLAFKACDAQL